MGKFMIEDVQVGVSAGGMACGPVSGNVICEVRVRRDDETVYYSVVVVDGPLFYCTDKSTFAGQISEEDDELFEYLQDHQFEGYDSYGECYADLAAGGRDPELAFLMKYLCFLASSDWDETARLQSASVGKCLGEFEIPMCDAEQEYLDMREEEE